MGTRRGARAGEEDRRGHTVELSPPRARRRAAPSFPKATSGHWHSARAGQRFPFAWPSMSPRLGDGTLDLVTANQNGRSQRLGRIDPHGFRRTASASMVICTIFPTTRPFRVRGAFQSTPKSWPLTSVLPLKPPRRLGPL